MDENKKEAKIVDNQSFVDRWQFVLSINDNIICQRYFKILGFDHDSLESEEFYKVMRECVDTIKSDLESKSRIYMWYTNKYEPLKLCGFKPDAVSPDFAEIISPKEDGVVVLSDGTVVEKTYLQVVEDTENEDKPKYSDERPEDGEVVFKFAFLFDNKVYYEHIWDGNVYPRYVRNTVDLSNSDIQYRNKDVSTLPFSLSLTRKLTLDRKDLIYHMIRMICDTCSNPPKINGQEVQKKVYTKKVEYGKDANGVERSYAYSTYNQTYIKGWRAATAEKTRRYEKWVNNYFSDKELDYINRRL